MQSYEIWLKGASSITGTMTKEEADKLSAIIGTNTVFRYRDGDGDYTIIICSEISAFAYRDEKPEEGIGF